MLIFRKMNSISSRLVPIRIRKKRRFVRRFLFDHSNGRIIHQFSLAPSPKNVTFQLPVPLLPPKNATFQAVSALLCRPKTLPLDCQNLLAAPKNATFKPPGSSSCRLKMLPLSHRILYCRPKTLPFRLPEPSRCRPKTPPSGCWSSLFAQKRYLKT